MEVCCCHDVHHIICIRTCSGWKDGLLCLEEIKGKVLCLNQLEIKQRRKAVMSNRVTSRLADARVLVATAVLCVTTAYAQEAPPQSDKAKEVVALVEKAAALINAKGKAGFAEMKQNPGVWRPGDIYLFASDINGVSMLNMGFPKLEGTDTIALKDSTGKFIVKEQIELIKSSGGGWVHYMWPKSGTTIPQPKWSYVKPITADGQPGYIGAGFYLE
jgi:cytochrome c